MDPIPEPRAIPLQVQGFGRDYDGTRAVDDLSFEVAAGEIFGLLGPNGAGKTTTLRSIAGVLPVREGNVRVLGHDVTREAREAKGVLAWVPDDPQPFETLSVWEHLEFTAALYRVQEWRESAEELLVRFELVEKRSALGGELSRGMRQKLALACAWLARPALVLLDEPLSGLDPRGIREAKSAIQRLASSGGAVVLSSHQLELIEELATKLLILNRGRMVFHGTLEEAVACFGAVEGRDLEEIFFAATEEPRVQGSRLSGGP
jgi:ABC-2 type transport system ATP-binding protein